ncbi:14044_t:CDS:2 [Entrophospora sp. SA101]|nr:14044_t:CDS:2 [Entrophospora sp. SA101]
MSNSNNIEIDELEINNKRKPIRILTPKEISKAFRIMASRKAERQIRQPSGTTVTGIVPTNAYQCSDSKYVIIGGNGDSIYKRLMEAAGRIDLTGEKYATNKQRVKHQQLIDDAINNWTKTLTSKQVIESLEQVGVPCGGIYNIKDIVNDEHVKERELLEVVKVGGNNSDNDSRASAFVADRGGNIKMNAKIEQIIQVIVEVCEASIKIFDEKNSWMKGSVLSFEFPLLDDLLLSKETEKIFHDGGKRMVLVILSLVGVLSTSKRPEYIQLARLFLLHIFILDYLPLKYRAAPPPPPFDDESEENRFMKEFYKFSAKALLSDGFKEITNSIADLRSNLGDFIDGIIFASLIRLQNNGKFSFPREIKNDFIKVK